MSTNTTKKITIAFDLYGTILSTESITEALSAHLGGNNTQAKAVSSRWRQYQLEYTWRMAAMGAYEPFDRVTRAALHHAAAEELGPGGLPDGVADGLMRSYDSLGVFPDVVPALETLRAREEGRRGMRGEGNDISGGGGGGGGGGDSTSGKETGTDIEVAAVIFSNGTEAMLRNSIDTSPDLRPFRNDDSDRRGPGGLFRRLITVHDARTYKPTPLSYSHLRSEAEADADGHGEALVWLVSANPFDVVGARSAGLPAAWIDRAGTGWVDGLGDVIFGVGGGVGVGVGDDDDDDARRQRARPTVIAKGVDEAVEEILRLGI